MKTLKKLLGVALAAAKNGIKSLICLPDGAPISKVEATKSYGAEVCLVDGVYDDAYNKAMELKDEKGYTFVHPFEGLIANVEERYKYSGSEEMKADYESYMFPRENIFTM